MKKNLYPYGLTAPRIRKMCEGIRVSGLIYEELRSLALRFLEEFLDKIVCITRYHGRESIQAVDVATIVALHTSVLGYTLPCKKSEIVFPADAFRLLIEEIAKERKITVEPEASLIIQHFTEAYMMEAILRARAIMDELKKKTLLSVHLSQAYKKIKKC